MELFSLLKNLKLIKIKKKYCTLLVLGNTIVVEVEILGRGGRGPLRRGQTVQLRA